MSWWPLCQLQGKTRCRDYRTVCNKPASFLKDGFGEQHCRIHCEQNQDQEKTLRCPKSEALPCQRPSAERGYVGSQPLGESDRPLSLMIYGYVSLDLLMFHIKAHLLSDISFCVTAAE